MNKLSLDALRERAEAVASVDLLTAISGGTENACHPGTKLSEEEKRRIEDSMKVTKDRIGGDKWPR